MEQGLTSRGGAVINPRWRGGSSGALRVFTVACNPVVTGPRCWRGSPNSQSENVSCAGLVEGPCVSRLLNSGIKFGDFKDPRWWGEIQKTLYEKK